MARPIRLLPAGLCFHALSRGNRRAPVFTAPSDYDDFLELMCDAQQRLPLDVMAACLMPNHFHVVARSRGDGDLSRWMQWLLTKHGQRFNAYRGLSGHVWQGRFKAFPIATDEHLLRVLRYVERNALRAGLVERSREWPWGSLAWRSGSRGVDLAEPPCGLPPQWEAVVDEPMSLEELTAIRTAAARQRPFGPTEWSHDAARACGLESSLRRRGRPRSEQPQRPLVRWAEKGD